MQRRSSIPPELEDPEDPSTVGSSQGSELFDSSSSNNNTRTMTSPTIVTPGSSSPATASSSSYDWKRLPREVRNLLAGGIAGMTAKSVVAPMDRIKILYQVSSAEFHFANLPSVVRNIVQTEGVAALWKGNLATMIRVFPYSGIQFMVFDRCKRSFLKQHDDDERAALGKRRTRQQSHSNGVSKHGLTALESLVAGMIAGSISVVCTYPLDLTRAQLAVLKKHKLGNKGFVAVLVDNYTQRGVPGLFRGITPTLLGILPYSGIAFTLNEQGKRYLARQRPDGTITTLERLQCGAVAGLFAQSATYPIEVTRRRMQTLGLVVVGNNQDTALGCLKQQKQQVPQQPESLSSTVRHLYAEQGIRGFFKGVSMNWMKGPVAFAISFTTFDTVQSWFETEAERAQRLPQ